MATELINEIVEVIKNFDFEKIGSVILLALGMCMGLVFLVRSICTTSIETVFMNYRKITRNDFYKLLTLLLFLTFANCILSRGGSFVLTELLIFIISFITFIVYSVKVSRTRKYDDGIMKLITYYKDKQAGASIAMLISIMPSWIIYLNVVTNEKYWFQYVVIVSTIEVGIIVFSMPDLLVKESNIYYMSNSERVYLYKRIDKETILCGNSKDISRSSIYSTISVEELKEKKIFHEVFIPISKNEKNKLRMQYEKNISSRRQQGELLMNNGDFSTLRDRYSFVAVFSYDEDGISIAFPDLPGCYPCADKDDTDMAIANAKEALGLHIWGMEQDGEEIPVPSKITDIALSAGQVPVIIDVFMPPIRERINSKFVKKTLSLPAWLAAKADEDGVNCSRVFQNALMDYLGVHSTTK